MQQKKRALGRGLGALLPARPAAVVPITATGAGESIPENFSGERLTKLPIAAISPNPEQPRASFDEVALEELAASIRVHGVIQPVAVTPRGDGYMIVAGERRWRAAQAANLREIPAIILSLSDKEILAFALVENLQRENLNAMEEARAYKALMDSFGLSQDEVADTVAKSRPAIANAVRLLKLPQEIQGDIESGLLSAGHARALLMLDSEKDQKLLRVAIIRDQLSVREAERMVSEFGVKASKPRAPRVEKDPNVVKLRERLIEALACKVEVKSTDMSKGRIEIYYGSLDELDSILDRLGVHE